eukprot:COSAG06_NODE_7350_length_2534_cov_19.102669_4_plen_254_part_00
MALTWACLLRWVALALSSSGSSGSSSSSSASDQWDPTSLQALETTLCSVERVPASELSPERFQAEYRGRKPVVIQGLTDGDGSHHDARWPAHDRWQKAALLRAYGDRSVAVREDSEEDRQRQANGHGGSKRIPLSEYIAQTFDRPSSSSATSSSSSARSLPPDAPLSKLGDVTYQFDRQFLKASAQVGAQHGMTGTAPPPPPSPPPPSPLLCLLERGAQKSSRLDAAVRCGMLCCGVLCCAVLHVLYCLTCTP